MAPIWWCWNRQLEWSSEGEAVHCQQDKWKDKWKDKWRMEEVCVTSVVPATKPPMRKSEWLEEKKI